MEQINEEQHLEKQWFEEAHNQTIETLPNFIDHIMNDYQHDYGTICHALSACALAAVWAANKHEQGGITGFQAGFVLWDFIREWMYSDNRTALKIVDYDKMLFPQYADRFDKTISKKTFEGIQEAAKENLNRINNGEEAHPDVIKHWKSIVAGNVPFGYKIKDND